MLLFAAMSDETRGPSRAGAAPPDAVALMARIRGGAGAAPGLWWWSGRVYGRRPAEIVRPLLTVTGIGFSRFTRMDDGSWQFAMSEAGFFADIDSGEFLTEWVNPYTGARLTPPPNRLVLRYRIAADGTIAAPFPGMNFDGRIGPVTLQGDTVWVGERLMANIPPPPPGAKPMGPTGNAAEFSSFVARRADAENTALAFCPATMHHQAAWPFYDWLGMAGAAGDIFTDISGCKLASADDVPPALRERIERTHPGLLANPGI
jgi:Protein of unknown function (DUF1838)